MLNPYREMTAPLTRITLPGIALTRPAVIALVGAGGKTTTLFRLACWLKAQGHAVLLSTTTRMHLPDSSQYDHSVILADQQALFQQLLPPPAVPSVTFCCAGVDTTSGKVWGLDNSMIDRLKRTGCYSVILLEADGAKGLPLKAADEHEPQIPASTDWVIAVTGAEVIGKSAQPEQIQRWSLFANRVNITPGMLLDATLFSRWINHPQGLFKNTPITAQRTWLINKVDNSSLKRLLLFSWEVIEQQPQVDSIWLACMQQERSIKYCTLNKKTAS